MLPLLVLVADVIGVLGGYLVSVYKLDFNNIDYINRTTQYLVAEDVIAGLVKAAVFGFLVTLMGCYPGLQQPRRRPGRGRGHHPGRGLGLDPDPHLRLHHHRDLLHPMTQRHAQDRDPGPLQVLRPQARPARARSRRPGRPLAGRHRRLGHRQVGADQVHPRASSRPTRARSRSTARRWSAPTARPLTRVRAKFGMLFQGAALFDSLPVWENVAFGLLAARHGPRARRRRSAIANLGSVGLGPEAADLFPAELSGGMQKRVGLARAIATKPEIIFFDEPTTGLDPDHGRRHQRPDRALRAPAGRHRPLDHPRHGQRAQDRRRGRDALSTARSSGRARSPGSTTAATPMSTSSSTAGPRARSRWPAW